MNVTFDRDGSIGYVTFNRPEKRNALNSEMLAQLNKILSDVSKDESIKVVILRGSGGNFCSGHDLSELLKDPMEVKRHFELCGAVMHFIRGLPQPVIAEVEGYAVAGGCQLVAVCDLAVASEDAKFGLPGIKLGVFCFTPVVFVSRNVSVKRAFELAITGEMIDAKTALDWGLVNRVVPKDRLEKSTKELAEKIARFSFESISSGKRFFYNQLEMNEFNALAYGINTISLHSASKSAREKIRSFLEKR